MKYTIDNPKKVRSSFHLKEVNFTGVVKDKDGNIAYYFNGEFHREDGTAVIWTNGAKIYFLNGNRHREDRPAAILQNGLIEYWLNNKYLDISTDQELKDYLALRMFE